MLCCVRRVRVRDGGGRALQRVCVPSPVPSSLGSTLGGLEVSLMALSSPLRGVYQELGCPGDHLMLVRAG